ncbi:MAG: hypothetical protein WA364_14275 [Candidatus Nitrosopolaris sp.]
MNGGIEEEIPTSPYVLDVEREKIKEVLQPERAATKPTQQTATQAENPPTREEILQLTTSSSNIGLPDSNNKNRIWQKPIRIFEYDGRCNPRIPCTRTSD